MNETWRDDYSELRQLGSVLCGLGQFMLTTGLVVGLTDEGYSHRYCYQRRDDAAAPLAAWGGLGHPSVPWIKCKGVGINVLKPILFAPDERFMPQTSRRSRAAAAPRGWRASNPC